MLSRMRNLLRAAALLSLLCSCGGAGDKSTMTPVNSESQRACEGGDFNGCDLVGMSLWLEARTMPEPKEGLSRALAPFQSACAKDDWFGCAMASSVQSELEQDPTAMATRAYPLAQDACKDEVASACAFLGNWAEQAKDSAAAAEHYAAACSLVLNAEKPGEGLDEFVCKKAIELGRSPESLKPSRSDLDIKRRARRISGKTNIRPPRDVSLFMQRRGIAKAQATTILCLSDQGVPKRIYFTEFSGAPGWDRKIFETMRTWRYEPMLDGEGKPASVCTSVTFIVRNPPAN